MLMTKLGRTLPQCDHASLDTNGLQLCAVKFIRTPRKLLEVDITLTD